MGRGPVRGRCPSLSQWKEHHGRKLSPTPLAYAGQASQFRAVLEINEARTYEVVVFAYDPANGNTGLDKTTFIVTE